VCVFVCVCVCVYVCVCGSVSVYGSAVLVVYEWAMMHIMVMCRVRVGQFFFQNYVQANDNDGPHDMCLHI